MSGAEVERDDVEVSRFLTGAAKAIARVRYCWLVTEAENGGVNARPMGRVLPGPDENDWNVRFVTDSRSRKASDIRRAGNVVLIFAPRASSAIMVSACSLRRRLATIARFQW